MRSHAAAKSSWEKYPIHLQRQRIFTADVILDKLEALKAPGLCTTPSRCRIYTAPTRRAISGGDILRRAPATRSSKGKDDPQGHCGKTGTDVADLVTDHRKAAIEQQRDEDAAGRPHQARA